MEGCICSIPKTWEVKQYSSMTREIDPSLIVGRRKMGWTKYNASLFVVTSCPSAMDAEADTKLKCPGANELALVTQDLLLSAIICPS